MGMGICCTAVGCVGRNIKVGDVTFSQCLKFSSTMRPFSDTSGKYLEPCGTFRTHLTESKRKIQETTLEYLVVVSNFSQSHLLGKIIQIICVFMTGHCR